MEPTPIRIGSMSDNDNASRSTDAPLHIAIIGSGSGAFAAAIKAAESGSRVTLVEGAEMIGGTCVNIGCVPSKIMIGGAEVAHQQGHHGYAGVTRQAPDIDRRAMVAQQQQWVETLRQSKYVDVLEQNPHINLVRGWARFSSANTLQIDRADGTAKTLDADRVLIATGARPHVPDIPGLADVPFWTSSEALVAETLPEKLVVLGGSVVALELAQAFLHLGVEVTLLARSTLLSKEDPAIGEALATLLADEGMDVRLHTTPSAIAHDVTGFTITTDAQTLHADQLLVATGRTANTGRLGLGDIGVETTTGGTIVVDDRMRTSVPHIYAVGDCTTLPQYVYVAAAAGTRAGINMTGGDDRLDLTVLPAVVFTSPQVATVGLTEAQVKTQGITPSARVLTLDNVPRAIANMDTRGFIKLVADAESGRLLGCQVLAAGGGEIIQTAALALRAELSVTDLAGQLFPYLTMVEGLKLCAQTFNKDVKQLSCCAG